MKCSQKKVGEEKKKKKKSRIWSDCFTAKLLIFLFLSVVFHHKKKKKNTKRAVCITLEKENESMGKTVSDSFKQKHRKNRESKTVLVFDEQLRK